MQRHTHSQLERWIGRRAVDKNGRRIGTVVDVYINDETGEPQWLAITPRLFGLRQICAPVAGLSEHGQKLQIAYDRATVVNAPTLDIEGRFDCEVEKRLYRHYEIDSGLTADAELEVVDTAVADLPQAGDATRSGVSLVN